MTDLNLDRLEVAAKGADNWGEWAIWHDLKEGGFVYVGNADGVIPDGEFVSREDGEPNPIAKCYTPEIAGHVAAADPVTVLALIARVRELEASVAEAWRVAAAQTELERGRAEAAEAKLAKVRGVLLRHYTGSPGFEKTPPHVREIDALRDLYDPDVAEALLEVIGGDDE